MKIKWLWGVIPVLIIYNERLIRGEWADATSYGVFVAMCPTQRNNKGLLAHELVHCKQFYRSLGINTVLYLLSRRHRYRLELEAYAKQAIAGINSSQDRNLTPRLQRAAMAIHGYYKIPPELTVDDIYMDLVVAVLENQHDLHIN